MDKDQAYLGIDPGGKGCMCLLVPVTGKIYFLPTDRKPAEMHNWLMTAKAQFNLRVIMIEDVHSVHGMSAKSNFMFGWNVGTVNTLASVVEVTLDRVAPKKWQKYIGVKTKGNAIKKEVAGICERLYPNCNIYGPKGGLLDGRSDALMIAHYASHLYKQNLTEETV